MPIGWMYILECCDSSFYTGSTKNLARRMEEHFTGNGAKHTKNRLPVKLVYFEKFQKISNAFYREKQIQKWRREKKLALIAGFKEKLPELSIAYRDKGLDYKGPSRPSSASGRLLGGNED